MSAFVDLRSLSPQQLADGYLARAVHGEQLTMAVVEVDAGAVLPEHDHANEQFGMVIEGTMHFRVGDETRTVGPGGLWLIPPGTPHTATAGETGAVVIDVFAPVRADWGALELLEPTPARWPG